jgi:hypothetical protein
MCQEGLYFRAQNLLQQKPVATFRSFIAMTQQRNVSGSAEPLEQTQCKLLAVILDGAIASVDAAQLSEFPSILARELAPTNRSFVSAFQ